MPTSFETVIGFDEFANKLGGEDDLQCGEPGKIMYFIKTDPKAYWNSETPWMNTFSNVCISSKDAVKWGFVNYLIE